MKSSSIRSGVLIAGAFATGTLLGLSLHHERAADGSAAAPVAASTSSQVITPADLALQRSDVSPSAIVDDAPPDPAPPPSPALTLRPFDATITGCVINQLGQPCSPSVEVVMHARDVERVHELWGLEGTHESPFTFWKQPDDVGQFVFTGLCRGATYRVTPSGGAAIEVTAPARGLELVVQSYVLEIDVVLPPGLESPSLHADWWRSNGSDHGEADLRAPTLRLGVEPDQEYAVEISGSRLLPVSLEHLVVSRTEAVRKVVVTMSASAGNRLVLTVTDTALQPQLDLEISDITHADAHDADLICARQLPGRSLAFERHGTALVLADLTCGRRVLALLPPRSSGLCARKVDLVIPEAGELRSQVLLVQGGRLRITTGEGASEAMPLLFVKGASQPLDLEFRPLQGDAGWTMLRSHTVYDIEPALPAGDYELYLVRADATGSSYFEEDRFRAAAFTVHSATMTEISVGW